MTDIQAAITTAREKRCPWLHESWSHRDGRWSPACTVLERFQAQVKEMS